MTKPVLLCAFLLSAVALRAQPGGPDPAATPAASDSGPAEEKAPAAIRSWLIPAPGAGALNVRLRSASPDVAPVTLVSARGGAPSLDESYVSVPAGTYLVELLAADTAVASEKVVLEPGSQRTALFHPGADGQMRPVVFRDAAKAPASALRALRVLNFAAGRATRLDLPGEKQAAVPANSVQEFQLPPQQLTVGVSVQAGDGGPPAQSFAVLDMGSSAASYLVVLPDSKGRMRPRFLAGAQPTPAPAAPLETPIVEVTPEQLRNQRVGRLQMELDSHMARLAVLDASEKGPNKIENAAQLRADLEKQIAETRRLIQGAKGGARAPAPSSPSESGGSKASE
jgi:hypothetical protein